MNTEHTRPGEIERASMAIITRELEEQGILLPPDIAPVVKRVIHATADFDFARNLVFTPGAAERGAAALARGGVIVTDTNMARSGISASGLEKLGGRAVCFMADPEVARLAKSRGTTRAAAAMEKACRLHPGALLAVGNAPTALLQLEEEIRRGLRPALVAAVPVGFVNVVQAKEMILDLCREKEIPAIVALGRKGGSTVAAALCNALIYSAAGLLDPAVRGW